MEDFGTDDNMLYDFGVKIAQGTVTALAKTVTSVLTLTGSVYALIHTASQLDNVFYDNQVALGGYANTLKAIDFATQKIADGTSFFGEGDILKGFKTLNAAGLEAKKYFDLVNEAASATNGSFAEMADTIRGGNFSSLAEAGLITDKMAQSYEAMGYNSVQASKKIVDILQQANAKGLFDNTIATFPNILRRFKKFGQAFVRSIVGDPKDPEGFVFTVKKYMVEVADIFYKNFHKIKAVGMAIGKFLKFVVDVVWDFSKRVFNNLTGLISINDKYWDNWEEKMKSFGLFLGIIRAKINHFYDEHGKAIKTFLKIALALFVLREIGVVIGNFEEMLKSGALAATLFEKAASFGYSLGSEIGNILKPFQLLYSAIRSLIPVQWSLNSAMAANPIGLIVVAIIALIAYIVILVKYWDQIREKMKGVSDGAIALALVFAPIVGIPMLLAKYWNEFKYIFANVWQTIKNVVMIAWLYITDLAKVAWQTFNDIYITPIINAFNWIKDVAITVFQTVFGWLETMIPGIREKFAWLIDPIINVIDSTKDFFTNFNFKNALDKVGNFFSGAADTSAEALAKEQEKRGLTKDVSTSVSYDNIVSADTQKLSNKGKTPDEIAAIQGSSYQGVNVPLPTANNYNTASSTCGGTVVQAGAVQIHVGDKMNPEELAKFIRKTLKELGKTDNLRVGVV